MFGGPRPGNNHRLTHFVHGTGVPVLEFYLAGETALRSIGTETPELIRLLEA
ncbi:hypothetical protein GCM10022226_52170 [Sphaerisporangium flaviroseum]|uniref:Uncharacterized protein n=1 Tax=Sphaerisporangium flaviroseum TaxID=509199 RepID=A0ABP7IS36_9ACTN